MDAHPPDDFKEMVRTHTNIVQLISETVALVSEQDGRVYRGRCPFHRDDLSNSFSVSPSRQSYKCWVCNEGGDCFSFFMKRDHLSFAEALKILADRADLEFPE